MKRLVTLLLSYLLFNTICFAQTRVAILGSLHEPSKYITQDTLLNAITHFKPDLILMELDTSLMDRQGNFRFDTKTCLECTTVKRFADLNPGLILRAADVANRNDFNKRHHIFANEAAINKNIDSLYKHNMLNDTSWFIVNSLYNATQILNNLSYMKLTYINSLQSLEATSFRQYLLYNRELALIKNNSTLDKFYSSAKEIADFWDVRNNTMVDNIANYAKRYKNKNILMIVGFYHKYALIEGLKKLENESNFILIDNIAKPD